MLYVSNIFALPTDYEVVAGTVDFKVTDESTLTINASNNAIVNYKSFDIAANEKVIVNLPDPSSQILNRVNSSLPTNISGTLICDRGLIILVNTSGIYVASTANIAAEKAILSTRDITNQNFIAGNYLFEKVTGAAADRLLLNDGKVTITNGGFGVFIAGAIENNGIITAEAGTIAMAAGDGVRLKFNGNSLVSIDITKAAAADILDYQGNKVLDQIHNSGTLSAKGGTIILTADALSQIFRAAINLEGIVIGTRLEEKDGIIKIVAESPVSIGGTVETTHLVVGSNIDSIISNVESIMTSKGVPTMVTVTKTARVKAEEVISIVAKYAVNVGATLEAPTVTIVSGGSVETRDAAIIQGTTVNLLANRFGTSITPVKIDAEKILIRRLNGDIDIRQSIGIGTSVQITGPPDGETINISYNRNASQLTLEGSRVIISGEKPTYLYGNITFRNFTCTTPGKEIYFEAGKTYTFKGYTNIEGVSSASGLIHLFSQEKGSPWYINLDTADYHISSVGVGDSYNLNGPDIVAKPKSSFGNNIGWAHNDSVYWLLAGAGNWSLGTNWNTGAKPTSADDVYFSAGSNVSTIDEAFTLQSLTIDGYTGTLTVNAPLTVTGNLIVNTGTLTGTQDVTVRGGSVTGNGTINLSGGTFLLDGTGDFGGNTEWIFYDLTFGDGDGAGITSKLGNNTVKISSHLKISLQQTLKAGSGLWNLQWGRSYLAGISKIVTGDSHTLALKNDGSRVYAWGRNEQGQLGNGTIVDSYTPVEVLGVGGVGFLSDISEIAVGAQHSLALKSDGSRVYAWGNGNSCDALGGGTHAYELTPIEVLGVDGVGYLTDISQIAAGNGHSLALKSDGSRVYGWGASGAVGHPYGGGVFATPVEVHGVGDVGFLTDICQIAAGAEHSVALKSDGSRVYAWGSSSYGQLGNNSTGGSQVPIEVLGIGGVGYLSDISQIDAGSYHTVALKSDGSRVYAWGGNWSGQLGNNSTTNSSVPVEVVGVGGSGYLGGISKITAGTTHTVALKNDGLRVYAWGDNWQGQLGNGSEGISIVPVEVVGEDGTGFLSDISEISAGGQHTVAVKSDGSEAYSWGYNNRGQLGHGSTDKCNLPIKIAGVSEQPYLSALTDISQISSNNYHSLALKSDGSRVYAWGINYSGQLGNGTEEDSYVPVEVVGLNGDGYLTDISQVVAGAGCSYALKSDGSRVYAWGSNLGNNTNDESSIPVEVLGVGGVGYLTDISQIAAGGHALALKSDGSRVYAWGGNYYGQLGNNSTATSLVPVEVTGLGGVGYLTDISKIACGSSHSLALKSDGSRVYAWGYNNNGQLGIGSTTNFLVPIEVLGVGGIGYLTNISQIDASAHHTVALKSDGSRVYTWGWNIFGQLGNNSTTDSSTPVEVLGLGGSGYLSDISNVSAGEVNTIALKSDGSRVYTWGENTKGQLGNSSYTKSLIPVEVKGVGGVGYLSGISQVESGILNHTALKNDGSRVYAWGHGQNSEHGGQLGNIYAKERIYGLIYEKLSCTPVEVSTITFGPFIIDGTFDSQSSTIEYSGEGSINYHPLTTTVASTTYNNIIFSGGTCKLKDDIAVTGELKVTDGEFISGANTVTLEGTNATYDGVDINSANTDWNGGTLNIQSNVDQTLPSGEKYDNLQLGRYDALGITIYGMGSGAAIDGIWTIDSNARVRLTVSAAGIDKIYDGSTAATVVLSDDRIVGKNDNFIANYIAAFDNKDVGNNKAVSVTGISFSGTDAGKYVLSSDTASTTANITPKALTVSATGVDKVYDGTTVATVTLSDDRIAGDVFADSYSGASFNDKDVANNKAVSVTGINITGTDAGNYTYNTTASTTADITPIDVPPADDVRLKEIINSILSMIITTVNDLNDYINGNNGHNDHNGNNEGDMQTVIDQIPFGQRIQIIKNELSLQSVSSIVNLYEQIEAGDAQIINGKIVFTEG